MTDAIATTTLPLPAHRRGKVRDVYELGPDRLLLVATDRVSAFDVVMHETVPFKGIVLTQLTAWWLRQLEPIVPHHMLGTAIDPLLDEFPALRAHREVLRGRIMVSRRTEVYPVECIMRGYLSGSAWKEYRHSGTLAGETLPPGLVESDRLHPAIFSPRPRPSQGTTRTSPLPPWHRSSAMRRPANSRGSRGRFTTSPAARPSREASLSRIPSSSLVR